METKKITNSQETRAIEHYRKPLLLALETNDKDGIRLALEPYKSGASNNYLALLSIKQRLTELAKSDYKRTAAVVTVALKRAFDTMNLIRPMSVDQILELTEVILDSSNEDFLALEDVVLFLQGLTRGKYGKLYESMDIPKFMELFEVYREERHQALLKHRDDEYLRTKEGTDDRFSQMPDKNKEAIGDYLKDKYNDTVGQTC